MGENSRFYFLPREKLPVLVPRQSFYKCSGFLVGSPGNKHFGHVYFQRVGSPRGTRPAYHLQDLAKLELPIGRPLHRAVQLEKGEVTTLREQDVQANSCQTTESHRVTVATQGQIFPKVLGLGYVFTDFNMVFPCGFFRSFHANFPVNPSGVEIMNALSGASWADLTEPQPEHTKTFIERGLSSAYPTWLEHGVVHLKLGQDENFLHLIDNYIAARAQLPQDRRQPTNYWKGWHFPTSYLVSPTMLSLGLCPQLSEPLSVLLNESPLLHLALTGWVSTERNWHQDSYLNPPNVWSSYVAAWVALEDINRNAGPFEFVPGSHRWEVLRQDKLFNKIGQEMATNPSWPSLTQEEVARICEDKIKEMGVKPLSFLPKKGDVLLWHSNLLHRGTEPKNSELLRKALILHYSGVSKRVDMNPVERYRGGFYFKGPTDDIQ